MAKRNQQTALRNDAQLDSRLGDYSAIARMSAAPTGLRGRIGNWPIYAAAAGSALAMATGASASIIYYGPSNNYNNTFQTPKIPVPSITATKGSAFGNFNLDPGGHKFGLKRFSGSSSGIFGAVQVLGIDKVHIFVSSAHSSFAKKFASGMMIGSKAGSFKADGEIARKAFTSGSVLGKFPASSTGFAGLAVTDGSHNVLEYGWIRLEVKDGGANNLPVELEAIDWAFNTSGEAINAGEEVSPSPEPGTMALGLLALGAAGVTALRHRRARTQG